MALRSVNPCTGEIMKTFPPHSAAVIDASIDAAHRALPVLKRMKPSERAECLRRTADLLESRKGEFARLMTLEMGKPIKSAREEILKSARACRFYGEEGIRLLADEPVATHAAHSYIRYDPLGVILAVMPWNFPFWQVLRCAAPALMAGNSVLLKHASSVPQCALAIHDLMSSCGLPEGSFQTLLIDASRVEGIIGDPRVRGITLTGSEPAGRSVAAAAGRMLKKTVMELGGSDPFIVLPGADLATAAQTAVRARIINNGQSCVAAKRFIVHNSVADEFYRLFIAGMSSLRIGDPMLEETELGPIASEDLLRILDDQVRRAEKDGARILLGGKRLEGRGSFYAPTVIADVPGSSPAYREEFFGPVALLFRVGSLGEAISLANDTPFGLGSSVWTQDPAEQERAIAELEAGLVFINGMVASDPRMPFGGVKASGYGRELGAAGLREFVNVKTVWVA